MSNLPPLPDARVEILSTNAPIAGRTLFRVDAVKRHSNQWLGTTTLAVPVSFKWYSGAAVSLAFLIVAFLTFGTYTTSERLKGNILPESGLNKVSSSSNGSVARRYVVEGQMVFEGDPIVSIRKAGRASGSDQPKVQQPNSLNTSSLPFVPTDVIASAVSRQREVPADVEIVTAPLSGLVFQLSKDVGESVYPEYGESVASIASPDGHLAINGYASAALQSKLQLGTAIRLELDAYKNQPNGRLLGTVTQISRAPAENRPSPPNVAPDPRYKISVRVDMASTRYTANKLLGMPVEMIIAVEKRHLYEWLLDPLQTLFKS